MSPPKLQIVGWREASEIIGSAKGIGLKHIISIRNSGHAKPDGLEDHPARKLELIFDDIPKEVPGRMAPTDKDVSKLVQFAKGVDGPLLTHCQAGISRSSAATLIIIAVQMGNGYEHEAIRTLLSVKQNIQPNPLMVEKADKQLHRNGKLYNAYSKVFKNSGGPDPGLCKTCLYGQQSHLVGHWRCTLSDMDTSFALYPRLPKHKCRGYKEAKRW